jgi:hypothetical protein
LHEALSSNPSHPPLPQKKKEKRKEQVLWLTGRGEQTEGGRKMKGLSGKQPSSKRGKNRASGIGVELDIPSIRNNSCTGHVEKALEKLSVVLGEAGGWGREEGKNEQEN